MNGYDGYRNALKQARGLGSAKDGVNHFVMQRITAITLVALGVYVLWLIISLVGADYVAARALVASPWNAVLISAFLIAMFWHAQLGIQVVIEDYVHTTWLATISQLLVRFICALAALASVFAVIRIAVAGA